MKQGTFVAVDFETATNNRFACQIGLVVCKDGQIVERIERLIQPPGNNYDFQPMQVHGIRPTMTASAPNFEEVWNEIGHYLQNTEIVAHNAPFDRTVLQVNADYYGIMLMGVDMDWTDTCYIFGKARLEVLCAAYGIDASGHHNALFDAECCAKFYLNYLGGVEPDWSKADGMTKKRAYRHETLHGDILKKDLTGANPSNPFYDRKVVITGEFNMERRELAATLKGMGADIDTQITKRTNFVLIGYAPGPAKMEKLEKLIHDGYHVRKLCQQDLDAIFAGKWEGYAVEKEIKKDLVLSYAHYQNNHIDLSGYENKIYDKELYYGKSFKGNFDQFSQITGNLGANGDTTEIYPDTQIIVLSDATVERLAAGQKDDTITYIENYYNKNKAIVFDLSFLSETDILDFCRRRCEKCGDEVTMELYNKYIASIAKEDNPSDSRYQFQDGEITAKVDGKIVVKLSDGRAWCPSRQIR